MKSHYRGWNFRACLVVQNWACLALDRVFLTLLFALPQRCLLVLFVLWFVFFLVQRRYGFSKTTASNGDWPIVVQAALAEDRSSRKLIKYFKSVRKRQDFSRAKRWKKKKETNSTEMANIFKEFFQYTFHPWYSGRIWLSMSPSAPWSERCC